MSQDPLDDDGGPDGRERIRTSDLYDVNVAL